MTEYTQSESDLSDEELELDSIFLDPEKILFDKISNDFFTFTSETKKEGRKIGCEIARSVMKQRSGSDYKQEEVDLLLHKLKDPATIADYRLDGNQLSYNEEYDETDRVWTVSVFQRYGSAIDIDRLNKAVESLGFITDKTPSDK